MLRTAVAIVVLLLAAPPVLAHDIWITTLAEGSGAVRAVVNHGHPGDRKPPDPDKLFEFVIVGPGQSPRTLLTGIEPATYDGHPVLMTSRTSMGPGPGVLLLAARYDNGYWVETPAGYRNTSKRQVPGAARSLSSMKYAKALLRVGPGDPSAYGAIVGHRLEIVPLANPFALRPGDRLRVKVLLDGKPLAGGQVERGDGLTPVPEKDIPRFATDAAGIAEIPIVAGGPQLLVIDHRQPSADAALADTDLLNATLAFSLAP